MASSSSKNWKITETDLSPVTAAAPNGNDLEPEFVDIKELGEVEVGAFLSHLAVQGNVAACTQNQALNALVFLYEVVLERPLQEIGGVVRAKKPQKLPVVLTPHEVKEVLRHLQGNHWLIGCLLYGSGLRLMEAVRLRVKDLDFDHRAILVRNGKGGKDRVVTFADVMITPIKQHLEQVRMLHDKDIADGHGEVYLPFALARKYPNAPREWHWQYVFPSGSRSLDPRSGVVRRHHVDESGVQKAVREAVRAAGIKKPRSRRRAIRFGIPLPRHSLIAAWTSARCRSNSDTRTFGPPKSIPTCSNGGPTACRGR